MGRPTNSIRAKALRYANQTKWLWFHVFRAAHRHTTTYFWDHIRFSARIPYKNAWNYQVYIICFRMITRRLVSAEYFWLASKWNAPPRGVWNKIAVMMFQTSLENSPGGTPTNPAAVTRVFFSLSHSPLRLAPTNELRETSFCIFQTTRHAPRLSKTLTSTIVRYRDPGPGIEALQRKFLQITSVWVIPKRWAEARTSRFTFSVPQQRRPSDIKPMSCESTMDTSRNICELHSVEQNETMFAKQNHNKAFSIFHFFNPPKKICWRLTVSMHLIAEAVQPNPVSFHGHIFWSALWWSGSF